MKKMKKILSILSAVTAISVFSLSAFAEDTTEAPAGSSTEAVTELTTEDTTEATAETTAPVTTVTTEETTTVTTYRSVILFEPGPGPHPEWTGGEYKKTIPLSAFNNGREYGDFLGLYRGTELVDSEYYTVTYDREKSITFTFGEKFREKYGNGGHNFSIEFENTSLENIFQFDITDPEEQTQIKSPKTGSTDVGALSVLLALSGVTAFISKRRK